MLANNLRIIVDTNLWVSFLISHRQDRLDDVLYSGNIRILFSTELLDEIAATIQKPKLRKYFPENAMEDMLLNIEPYIDIVDVKSTVNICRDEKDNFLLVLARDGNADFLLTGDDDLLALKKFGKTKIVTIRYFLDNI